MYVLLSALFTLYCRVYFSLLTSAFFCGSSSTASSFVTPLLTDMYQITMAYAYFVQGKENVDSVFDLFFRENPFSG